MYDITPERAAEANKSAKKFGFEAKLSEPNFPYPNIEDLQPEDTILVPSVKDAHPHHKQANLIGRRLKQVSGCSLLFYSVDMNNVPWRMTLPNELVAEKKAALQELFPSQSVLLADEKYHLFEAITDKETEYVQTFNCLVGSVEITSYRKLSPSTDNLQKIRCIDDAVTRLWDPTCVTEIKYINEYQDTEVFRG